jgi:arabinogalactan endo-1,4-beta-galactosidase
MADDQRSHARQISRRALINAGAAAIAAAAASADLPTPAGAAARFIKGCDVSWAPQMEAHGYTWKDARGETRDLLKILAGYGISAIRLRTFVNPSGDRSDGHCSITEVAAYARRVKDAGMSILLDFMFGDTWNSVGRQYPPASWASMSYPQMRFAMSSYVTSAMNVLKANDVLPTWVQIGNEINSGICHPIGAVSRPAQMTGLLNAAHDAVKAVSPNIGVIIHLAQPQNYSSIQKFYGNYAGNGGAWDMCGFSSYGSADLAAVLVANMKKISDAHGKPFMQVECGGGVTKASSTQAKVNSYIRALKANGGLGLFYWEPECMTPFTSYGMGAWDSSTHRPTTIMNAFANA